MLGRRRRLAFGDQLDPLDPWFDDVKEGDLATVQRLGRVAERRLLRIAVRMEP